MPFFTIRNEREILFLVPRFIRRDAYLFWPHSSIVIPSARNHRPGGHSTLSRPLKYLSDMKLYFIKPAAVCWWKWNRSRGYCRICMNDWNDHLATLYLMSGMYSLAGIASPMLTIVSESSACFIRRRGMPIWCISPWSRCPIILLTW